MKNVIITAVRLSLLCVTVLFLFKSCKSGEERVCDTVVSKTITSDKEGRPCFYLNFPAYSKGVTPYEFSLYQEGSRVCRDETYCRAEDFLCFGHLLSGKWSIAVLILFVWSLFLRLCPLHFATISLITGVLLLCLICADTL